MPSQKNQTEHFQDGRCASGSSFHNEAGVSDSQLPCYWNSWADPAPPSHSSSHSFLKGYPLQQGVGASQKFPTPISCPSWPVRWASCLILFLGSGAGDRHYVPTPPRLPVPPAVSQGPFKACFLSVWPQEVPLSTRRAHTVRPSGPNSVLARTTNPDILRNHMDRITSYPQLTNGLGYCNQ